MVLENHETSRPASDTQVVIFLLDEQRYAVPMDSVERVIRAVAVTPVPETPEFVLGLINMAGCRREGNCRRSGGLGTGYGMW